MNSLKFWLVIAISWFAIVPSYGQTIDRVDPPMITIGKTKQIRVQGNQLNRIQHWITTTPLKLRVNAQKTNSDRQVFLLVDGDPSSHAGINLFRGIGPGASTQWFPIAIDKLENLRVQPMERVQIISLESARGLVGFLSGQQQSRFELLVKKNQQVKLEVESVRLGSKLRPQLVVLDAQQRQIAWSQPMALLGGDTWLSFRSKSDQKITIVIQDQLSRAPANSLYRIKLNADSSPQVFPTSNTPAGGMPRLLTAGHILVQKISNSQGRLATRHGKQQITLYRLASLFGMERCH